MPEPQAGQMTLYDFRSEEWADVLKSLQTLIKERERLLGLGIPAIEKMYGRVEPIYATAKSIDEANPVSIIDRELIRFLQPSLVEHFTANPEDESMRDYLASLFIMLSAATNNFPPDDFIPYNADELSAIVAGRGDFFDDIMFIRSLRHYLNDAESAEPAAIILNSLPSEAEEKENYGKQAPEYYFWDDALIFALMLQVVWKHFYSFNDRGQEFLLKNYFYRGLVSGVPAREWLKLILQNVDNLEERKKTSLAFAKHIENNTEAMPVDVDTLEARPLSEIVQSYISVVYDADVDILAQEKFIEDFYREQVGAEMFEGWLREALFIVLKLRKNELG